MAAIASLAFASKAWAVAEVTVVKAGPGAALGTVTSTPAGIDCGSACGPKQFVSGGKLTAVPADLLSGWSGITCAGGPQSNPCDFPKDLADRTATATFVTPPDDPPLALTGGVAPGANEQLITLEGSVNPREFKVNECRFEYDTREYKEGDAPHGRAVPCSPDAAGLGEGADPVDVSGSVEVEELRPGTTYHYRLLATNFRGSSAGEDRTFASDPAPADACSNAVIRRVQVFGAILLPDCMALELVNSPKTGGQVAKSPDVSADGGRVRFLSAAPLAETPGLLSLGGDLYVASRTATGWLTAPTVPPPPFTSVSGFVSGAAFSLTPDFSCWLEIVASDVQVQLGESQVRRGCLDGSFVPISPLLVPVSGGWHSSVKGTDFRGASAEGSHFYFSPGLSPAGGSLAYLPGDPVPAGTGFDPNTYVAWADSNGQISLELMALDRFGKVWGGNCGARLGGIGGSGVGARNQGALSLDGARAYFSTRPGFSTGPGLPAGASCSPDGGKLRILQRVEDEQGVTIGPLFGSECNRLAPVCDPTDGDDFYQGASLDGTRVYFTSNRQLADSDLDSGSACSATLGASAGCDLYLYDATLPAGERLVQVSAGETGSGAKVLNSITAISSDGSHVYFVAQGILTGEENDEGDTATAGQPNLYLYQRDEAHPDGRTAFLGTLASGDAAGLWGGEGTFVNHAYPVPAVGAGDEGGDGHVLLFESKAALTADDADGLSRDVFRYDAGTEALQRISKAVPGGADNGAFDVIPRGAKGALGTDFAEDGRWASEDGETVVFATAEGLVPGDVDGTVDSYLWRDGQLARLPGNTYTPSSTGLDGPSLSHDGSVVAFQTSTPLLPADGNTVPDVYVARAGGGFAEPPPPAVCAPDAGAGCQGAATTAPGVQSPASAGVFAGNVTKQVSCPKGKRKVRRKGKARCVKAGKTRRQKRAKHRHRSVGGKQGGRR